MNAPHSRRHVCLALLSLPTLLACSRPEPTGYEIDLSKLSPEEKVRAHRFRGINSIELRIDGFGTKIGVNLFDHNGRLFNSHAEYRPDNAGTILRSAGSLSIPVTLRGEWRDAYYTVHDTNVPPKPAGYPDGSYWGGNIIGNYTIAVAERIPDALLDELRKNGGQFRLKIRLHDDGILIGWEIERRPGYKPGGPGAAPAYFMTGGDFKEARPAYYIVTSQGAEYLPYGESYPARPLPPELIAKGYVLIGAPTPKLWEKGWYIHPKTGQRIETDF